jgi:Zn-dependent peptidase ImmA (M78 family)
MKISRMDLADVGSPEGLVKLILKLEPDLPIPVPIEELAIQLDIERIAELETDGFEGGLITDDGRSTGIILVNKAARNGRRRFTIGHELAHFLIPTHRPIKTGQFLCSREDMRQWSLKETDAYRRMEVEANRFAALLLMPPPKLRVFMGRFRDPDIARVIDIAKHFDVSKDSASRAFAEYNESPVAVVVIKDGKVKRIYKNARFPRTSANSGDPVPAKSLFHYEPARRTNPSDICENGAELWIESEWGKRLPTLYEQVFFQQDGFALLMLSAELPDEDEETDEDDNRTSKERHRHRQANRDRY